MLMGLKLFIRRQMLRGVQRICRLEFERRSFTRFSPHCFDYEYVFRQIRTYCPVTVLDVGSGDSALPAAIESAGCVVTAIDNIKDYWPTGMINRHYHVIDDDIMATRINEQFDCVICIGTLQHVLDAAPAVRNMFKLLKPGGKLVLTTAYTEHVFYPDVYSLPGAAYKPAAGYACRSYSRAELDGWIRENGARLVHQEFIRFWTGEFWTAGDQVVPPQIVGAHDPHQYTCLVLEKPKA